MTSQFITWICLFCIKSLILNSGQLLLMILMKRPIWYSWSVACLKCLKIELLSRKILVFFVTFCHTYLALEKVIGMLPFFRQLSYTLLPRGKCKSYFYIILITILGSMSVCLGVPLSVNRFWISSHYQLQTDCQFGTEQGKAKLYV